MTPNDTLDPVRIWNLDQNANDLSLPYMHIFNAILYLVLQVEGNIL